MSRNLAMTIILDFGFTAWVYVKMMKSTSSDVKTAVMVGAISFGVFFLICYFLLGMLPSWWNG